MATIPNLGANNAARASRSAIANAPVDKQASGSKNDGGSASGMKVKRLNLNLSEKTYQRLLYLQENTDALNSTDVVREALRVYDALVSESIHGKKIALLDPNKPDEIEILRLF